MLVCPDMRSSPPPNPHCDSPVRRRIRCVHGWSVMTFGCGKCGFCNNQWRRRVAWRIAEGMRGTHDAYQFVTLTFANGPATPEVALRAWRSFRRRASKTYGFGRYFRVLELHKSGGVHIHLV